MAIVIPRNGHHQPHTAFRPNQLTMNSVFCKGVLGTQVVLISTFPGTGTEDCIKLATKTAEHC